MTKSIDQLLKDIAKTEVAEGVAEAMVLLMPEIERKIADLGMGAPKLIKVQIPDVEEQEIENPHPKLELVLKILCNADIDYRNCYAWGPAGSGKSVLGKQAAKALNVPWITQGCLTSKFEISGFIDANGNYQESLIYTWLKQEQGAVLILEEIDRGIPAAIVQLNEVMANGTYTFSNGETLTRTSKHYVFANGNTNMGGRDRNYSSSQIIDKSTVDRFGFIHVGYDEEFELQITPNKDWTRRVQLLRRTAESLNLDLLISTRAAIAGASLLAAKESQQTVEDVFILKGCSPDITSKLYSDAGNPSTRTNGTVINFGADE